MGRLLVVMVITVFIHLIITLNYSIRLAGLRTRRLLTAISIFNVIYLFASVSNVIQAPLMTSIVEHSIKSGILRAGADVPAGQLIFQDAYKEQLVLLERKMRLVILASTAGSVIGAFMIPAVVRVFIRAVRIFEEVGSAPMTLIKLFFSLPWRRAGTAWPRYSTLVYLFKQKLTISKNLLLANVIMTGFYTTGVLSALYAGVMLPDFRSTATALSVIINGAAILTGAVVLEPTLSSITDQALCGARSEADIKQMTACMALTRILGTLFAQAIILPCAYLIKYFAQFLV
ncbi:MAG: hypothetical protein A4E55_00637 [Pelotomaculum sp. PtaU1.Bin035]|nr:MAG: hypothetical protein A4E55_00637 [Pelotomaculum sp. PtaU1.Bin035]